MSAVPPGVTGSTSPLRCATAAFVAELLLSSSSHPLAAQELARVDRFLQGYVDSNRIAGAVVLVLRDGKPVYERGVGWADRETKRPMTPSAIFRIASESKPV